MFSFSFRFVLCEFKCAGDYRLTNQKSECTRARPPLPPRGPQSLRKHTKLLARNTTGTLNYSSPSLFYSGGAKKIVFD